MSIDETVDKYLTEEYSETAHITLLGSYYLKPAKDIAKKAGVKFEGSVKGKILTYVLTGNEKKVKQTIDDINFYVEKDMED